MKNDCMKCVAPEHARQLPFPIAAARCRQGQPRNQLPATVGRAPTLKGHARHGCPTCRLEISRQSRTAGLPHTCPRRLQSSLPLPSHEAAFRTASVSPAEGRRTHPLPCTGRSVASRHVQAARQPRSNGQPRTDSTTAGSVRRLASQRRRGQRTPRRFGFSRTVLRHPRETRRGTQVRTVHAAPHWRQPPQQSWRPAKAPPASLDER